MGFDRSVSMKIIADISDYQKELAKLPGYTEKQAAAMARKFGAAQIKMEAAAAKAAAKSAKSWNTAFNAASLAIFVTFATKAAQAMFSIANSASEFTDQMLQAEAATGISADSIAALNFALQAGGTSLDEARPSLAAFTARLLDASVKGGEAAENFERLGVSIKDDVTGEMREADVVLRETLEAMGGLENRSEAAGIATKLLGESGGKLVAALGPGAEAWDFYAGSIENAGIKMDTVSGDASKRMDTALTDIDLAVQGLTQSFGNQLVPWIDRFAIGLTHIQNLAKTGFDNAAAMELTETWFVAREKMIAAATASDELTGAMGDQTGEGRKLNVVLKEQVDLHAQLAKMIGEQTEASFELNDIANEASSDLDTRKQGIIDEMIARQEAADAALFASEDVASHAEASMQIRARLERDLTALAETENDERVQANAEAQALIDAASQEAADAEIARIGKVKSEREAAFSAIVSSANAVASEIQGIAETEMADRLTLMEDLQAALEDGEDTLTDGQKHALEKRIKAQRDAALESFNVAKGLAIGQIVTSTAVAIMMAAASAPPPWNLIPMGLMAAAGGIQAGIVAAEQPSFHTGGMVGRDGTIGSPGGMAPDEVSIRARAGERVLTEQQQAQMQAPIMVDARPRYEHRGYGRFMADHSRLTPGTRAVGHKQRNGST